MVRKHNLPDCSDYLLLIPSLFGRIRDQISKLESKHAAAEKQEVDKETEHRMQLAGVKSRIHTVDPDATSDLFAISFYKEMFLSDPKTETCQIIELAESESMRE